MSVDILNSSLQKLMSSSASIFILSLYSSPDHSNWQKAQMLWPRTPGHHIKSLPVLVLCVAAVATLTTWQVYLLNRFLTCSILTIPSDTIILISCWENSCLTGLPASKLNHCQTVFYNTIKWFFFCNRITELALKHWEKNIERILNIFCKNYETFHALITCMNLPLPDSALCSHRTWTTCPPCMPVLPFFARNASLP